MPWGALLSGGLSLLGNVFSARSAERGQEAANQANLNIAREQMAFQERMFNTRHQREVEDLRAAGLNPILSALNGPGSAPNGASAVMENTKGLSSTLYANSAKMLSETLLNREMAKTERTKQEVNKADAQAKQGSVGIQTPWGGFTVPIPNMVNNVKRGFNAVSNRVIPAVNNVVNSAKSMKADTQRKIVQTGRYGVYQFKKAA